MEENLQAVQTSQTETSPSIEQAVLEVPTEAAAPVVKKATSATTQLGRSLIGTIALLIVTVSIFVAQTFAYFTDSSSTQKNRITPGKLDISIIEVNEGGNFDWMAQPVKVMPASVFTYGGVGVQNTGTLPVYIRIKVEKSILQSEHEISPGWESLIACNFMANNDSLPEEQKDLWVYHEGYYYYKKALAPGEETTSLFDTVLFSPNMGNEFKNCSIQFKLLCQSVQSGGNSLDPTTAWGWPDEQSTIN